MGEELDVKGFTCPFAPVSKSGKLNLSHPFSRTNQLTSPLPSSPWVSDPGLVWGFVFIFLEAGGVVGCQTLPAAASQAGTSAHIPSWFIREAGNLPFRVPLWGNPYRGFPSRWSGGNSATSWW